MGPLLMPVMAVASIAGTAISAMGSIAAGQAAMDDAKTQAAEYRRKGKEEAALGQMRALEEKRKKEYALSKLQANAAASGFDATSGNVLDIGGEIEKGGTLKQQFEYLGGQSKKRDYQHAAVMAIRGGQAAQNAAGWDAAGTIVGGIGSLAKSYLDYK